MRAKRSCSLTQKRASPEVLAQGQAELTLELGGELTIGCAPQVKAFLLDSLGQGSHFQLEVRDPLSIDLSIVQLLIAFDATARREGKRVSMGLSLAPDQALLLERAGLRRLPPSHRP